MAASAAPASAWAEIRGRLDALRRSDQRISALQGLLFLGAVSAILMSLVMGVEAILWLKPTGRTLLFGACALLVGGLFFRWCIGPFINLPGDDLLAKRIDHQYPELNDGVTTVLQLWQQREQGTPYYSSELLDAALADGIRVSRGIDFLAADDRWRVTRAGKVFAASLLVPILAFAFWFTPLAGALNRFAHPLTDFPVPVRTQLTVSPGDLEVSVGGQATITVETAGEIPTTATLHLFNEEAREQTVSLSSMSPSTFSHTLRDLKSSTVYQIEAGDAISPRYRISVVDHPDIASLHLFFEYPSYTRLASRTTSDGGGDLSAIKGSRVMVEVESTQPLAFARIEFENQNEPLPMVISGTKAQANILVSEDRRYRVLLENAEGRVTPDPPVYQITALPDHTPDVAIITPGRDVNLTENMMVSLMITGVDDFGFNTMNLVYQKGAEGEPAKKVIPVERGVTTFSEPYVWDLAGLELFPGDVVSYHVELFDNDTVSGPKRGVSQTYTIRFPSIAEIYDQLENTQKEQVTDFEEMLKSQEKTRERLKEISDQLAQQPELDRANKQVLSWEKKKEIESLVAQQEQMAESALKAAEAMKQAMDQLGEQDSQSTELIEKMNQLRQLFNEIATPELMKALQDVRDAMKKMDSKKLQASMKDFSAEQEEFMKRLERSLSILKRLQAEQQMTAAVRKTEELLKRQEELKYATQDTERKPSDQTKQDLAKKQSELQKDTESLQKDLDELAQSMENIENAPSEGVKDVAQSMRKQNLTERMGKISGQLSSGQMASAAEGQQQVSENLAEMSQQLQEMKEQMAADERQEIAEAIRQAMRQLVQLSKEQEDLLDRTGQPGGLKSRMQDLSDDQQGLFKGTSQVADQLVETSQKSFFISPEIGQSLGESLNRMQSANNGLTQRERGTATGQQAGAMQALNQTVLALQKAMSDMNSSGSSTGMMEMLQQLQAMAQQQSGVNDQMNQMMDGQKSGKKMSQQDRAQMSRLASQQEAIRKSLEQIQRENQEEKQLGGRLSEIEREMRETIKQLQQQQVDPQLVQRQQRILSRLLDSARSMREKDYEEKRMAKPGDETMRTNPPGALPADLLSIDKVLRDDLLRSVRDGSYPAEYETLIRAYFRALSDTPKERN